MGFGADSWLTTLSGTTPQEGTLRTFTIPLAVGAGGVSPF